MTEAQVRQAVEALAAFLVVTVVATLVVWAFALACGVYVHPLLVFAFAAVSVWVGDGLRHRWRRSS